MNSPFAEAILNGSLLLAIPVALLAGLVSFLSPCVLPLVPGYLGYVTGLSGVDLEKQKRGRMLAGIGLPLMFSQLYPMADTKAPGAPLDNMAGVPDLIGTVLTDPQALIATLLGVATIVLSFVWKKAPGPVRKIPAALVAVAIGIAVAALPGVEVKTLQVGNLLASVRLPGAGDFAGLADVAVLTSVVTFTPRAFAARARTSSRSSRSTWLLISSATPAAAAASMTRSTSNR